MKPLKTRYQKIKDLLFDWSIDRVAKLIAFLVILALALWIVFCFKFWSNFRDQRRELTRSIEAMPPLEKEKFSYDLMAAMFNASQTNWTMTVTITPRTNQ